jgi:hypothetical protein
MEVNMTRSTRDLCQDCWQERNPSQYCPDLTRWGRCAECGADALITRSTIANETVVRCGCGTGLVNLESRWLNEAHVHTAAHIEWIVAGQSR